LTHRSPRFDSRWAALLSSPSPRGRRSPPWDLTVVGVLRVSLHPPFLSKWIRLASVKLVPSLDRTVHPHRRRCAATGHHRPPLAVTSPFHPIPIHSTSTNRRTGWRRTRGGVRLAERALLRRARARRSSRVSASPASGHWPRGPARQCRARAGALSGPRARECVGRVFRAGPVHPKWNSFLLFCHWFLYKLEKYRSRVLMIQKSWDKFCWGLHDV
jgi:hypothetical protein